VPQLLHLACASHRIFRHNHQYQLVKVDFSPFLRCGVPAFSRFFDRTDDDGVALGRDFPFVGPARWFFTTIVSSLTACTQ
jgi:hypothetical protein